MKIGCVQITDHKSFEINCEQLGRLKKKKETGVDLIHTCKVPTDVSPCNGGARCFGSSGYGGCFALWRRDSGREHRNTKEHDQICDNSEPGSFRFCRKYLGIAQVVVLLPHELMRAAEVGAGFDSHGPSNTHQSCCTLTSRLVTILSHAPLNVSFPCLPFP